MKRCLILVSAFVVTSCDPPNQKQRTDLMTAIEQRIELPSGSEPLASYARAYKFAQSDRISAVYFLPDDTFSDETCQSVKSYGRTNGQIALLCPPPDGIRAGESRWLENDVHMPGQSDGGCSFIEIEYSISLKAIISADCNGEA